MTTSSNAPKYKLHAPWSVGFAAMLGTPLAGAMLLALNYRCLGKKEAACQSLAIGLGVSLLELSFLMVPSAPKHLEWLGLVQGLGAAFIAHRLQGESLNRHLEDGGSIASVWASAGASIFSVIIIILLGLLGYMLVTQFTRLT